MNPWIRPFGSAAEPGSPSGSQTDPGTPQAGTREAGTSEAGTGEAGAPEAGTDYDVAIRPDGQQWWHTGLLVVDLADGQERRIATGECEYLVLPLAGGDIEVRTEAATLRLSGRADVFSGPADCAYLPRATSFTVRSLGGGRVALPFAVATADLPPAVVRAAEVPVELRGAGPCSRQVHNFGTPAALDASAIIACEVITPAGNWSSYPPHKHDEYREGLESELEEIYYFELGVECRPEPASRAPSGAPKPSQPLRTQAAATGTRPLGYQCVYGTPDRPIDVTTPVTSGDVVLVPHGWHGPAMAAPGYDMYYLNVMAGPGPERIWLICDDPSHAWVRGTWDAQQIDPRLPLHQRR